MNREEAESYCAAPTVYSTPATLNPGANSSPDAAPAAPEPESYPRYPPSAPTVTVDDQGTLAESDPTTSTGLLAAMDSMNPSPSVNSILALKVLPASESAGQYAEAVAPGMSTPSADHW